MTRQVGIRVGAVSHAEDGTLYLFGYGTYKGRKVPTEENSPGGFMGESIMDAGRKNPCIELDSGSIVWGCECWWGSEEKIKEWEENADEVKRVDIDEQRTN